MKSINWSGFNGEKFQSFCNIFFSFELEKKYTPFKGLIADQGVNGLFEENKQKAISIKSDSDKADK